MNQCKIGKMGIFFQNFVAFSDKKWVKKECTLLYKREWWSGAHSFFENGSERMSALNFFANEWDLSEDQKIMNVEHFVKIIKCCSS